MAYQCKLGYGECDGCGDCSKPKFVCPICEAGEPEKIYTKDSVVIGCSYCIEEENGEDYFED